MNKTLLTLTLIIFTILKVNAQVYVNAGVDTTDVHIKSVVQFYTNYMADFKGRKLPDFKQYWSEADYNKYKVPDPSIYGIGGDFPTYAMATSKTISYVKPLKNGITVLKSLGSYIDSLKNVEILYLTNHFIKTDDNQKLHFITPLSFYNTNWTSKKIRNINFKYQKNHVFDNLKADSLINQIKDLEKQWNLKPIEIEYFFADTYDEIQLIRGFDFTIGLGNRDKPSGIANQTDNIVYCAGNGENYFHEVVHIYLNQLHPKSPLNEGLAVYYGGSMGKNLKWHSDRLKTYLNNHPEIDLAKLEDFWQMDNFTNPNATIQGILCNAVFKKHGFVGLKRLMKYESFKEIFEKEFKFDLKNQNQELRKLIASQ